MPIFFLQYLCRVKCFLTAKKAKFVVKYFLVTDSNDGTDDSAWRVVGGVIVGTTYEASLSCSCGHRSHHLARIWRRAGRSQEVSRRSVDRSELISLGCWIWLGWVVATLIWIILTRILRLLIVSWEHVWILIWSWSHWWHCPHHCSLLHVEQGGLHRGGGGGHAQGPHHGHGTVTMIHWRSWSDVGRAVLLDIFVDWIFRVHWCTAARCWNILKIQILQLAPTQHHHDDVIDARLELRLFVWLCQPPSHTTQY